MKTTKYKYTKNEHYKNIFGNFSSILFGHIFLKIKFLLPFPWKRQFLTLGIRFWAVSNCCFCYIWLYTIWKRNLLCRDRYYVTQQGLLWLLFNKIEYNRQLRKHVDVTKQLVTTDKLAYFECIKNVASFQFALFKNIRISTFTLDVWCHWKSGGYKVLHNLILL